LQYARYDKAADELVKTHFRFPTIINGKKKIQRIPLFGRVTNSALSDSEETPSSSNGAIWLTLNSEVKNLFINVTNDKTLNRTNGAIYDSETKTAYRITAGHSEWDYFSLKGAKSKAIMDFYKLLTPWKKIGTKTFEINYFYKALDFINEKGEKIYEGRVSRLNEKFLKGAIEDINLCTNIFIEPVEFIKTGKKNNSYKIYNI
jgi:hypothetical protein